MNEAIKEFFEKHFKTIKKQKDLDTIKRLLSKKYKINILSNSEILKYYQEQIKEGKMKKDGNVEKILRKRAIRTLSGVAPVAVLTKSYPCPGNCVYCPNQPNVPASYLSNEPAVMRAIRCKYDPYKQVQDRLRALEANGHNPNKIELIVIGGTWSYLPKDYQYWYIVNCFKACNDFSEGKKEKIRVQKNVKKLQGFLYEEQKKNESAKYRIIGLTLETRPDYIDKEELETMRELGCTRVEIGVQAISDRILKINNRGHKVEAVVKATELLKKYGFKVTYHLMPGLPGATSAQDFAMFKRLFSSSKFQPDQIKFYPTVVVKGSLLYSWWKKGKYKPYSDRVLQNLIIKCKNIVPKYVRIIRLIRDIPGESIEAGNKITNLRQILKDKGVKCNCIRCREAGDKKLPNKLIFENIEYDASGGKEYFLSLTDEKKEVLYGFCRLRIDKESPISPAIIRELHVYGELMSEAKDKKIQHKGLGKRLLKEAEEITKKNKINELGVISGVGVKGYYRKQGFDDKGTYLVKKNI